MANKLEFTRIALKFETLSLNGRTHVISKHTESRRNSSGYPTPNYLGTHKSLVGVLPKNRTLTQFKDSWVERKLTIGERSLLVENFKN